MAIRVALAAVLLAACGNPPPLPDAGPQAQLFAQWNPRTCRGPYRVVIDLEDSAGAPLDGHAPCPAGGAMLDVPHWGIYRGRVFADTHDQDHPQTDVRIEIDEPVVYWMIDTP